VAQKHGGRHGKLIPRNKLNKVFKKLNLTVDEDELDRALFLIGSSSAKAQFDAARLEEVLITLDRVERTPLRRLELGAQQPPLSGTTTVVEVLNQSSSDNSSDTNETALISTNPTGVTSTTSTAASDEKDLSETSATSSAVAAASKTTTGQKEHSKMNFAAKVKNSIKVL
jgi:hypothetical protein